MIRNKDMIEATAYMKPASSHIYLNWKSFSPSSWKRGTLKIMIRRAYLIGSTCDYLQDELGHIAHVFQKFDNYPKWVINQLSE